MTPVKCKDCGNLIYSYKRKNVYKSNICDKCWDNRLFLVQHLKFVSNEEFAKIQHGMRKHYPSTYNKIEKIKLRFQKTINCILKNRFKYRIQKF